MPLGIDWRSNLDICETEIDAARVAIRVTVANDVVDLGCYAVNEPARQCRYVLVVGLRVQVSESPQQGHIVGSVPLHDGSLWNWYGLVQTARVNRPSHSLKDNSVHVRFSILSRNVNERLTAIS